MSDNPQPKKRGRKPLTSEQREAAYQARLMKERERRREEAAARPAKPVLTEDEKTERRRRQWRESARQRRKDGRAKPKKYVPRPPKPAPTEQGIADRKARAAAAARAYYVRTREMYREKDRERSKAWRTANKERQRELTRAWVAANPERDREIRTAAKNRRRAREKGAAGNITASELRALRAKAGKSCAACGAKGRMTVDHILPLALGGEHTARNIQFLCHTCNSAKGAKPPLEWARDLGLLC